MQSFKVITTNGILCRTRMSLDNKTNQFIPYESIVNGYKILYNDIIWILIHRKIVDSLVEIEDDVTYKLLVDGTKERIFFVPYSINNIDILQEYDEPLNNNVYDDDDNSSIHTTSTIIKALCSQCNNEFMQKTLDKYDGVCRKCNIKNTKLQKQTKSNLIDLNDDLQQLVIDPDNNNIKTNDTNIHCITCNKNTTKISKDKYSGLCYNCFTKAKPSISKKLRREVWNKRSMCTVSACFCCKQHLDIDNFECGHIISHFNGGSTELLNLEPICRPCNRSCGTKNLYQFMKDIK